MVLWVKIWQIFIPSRLEFLKTHHCAESENSDSNFNDEESDSDSEEYLQDGECELCERYIKLTRHTQAHYSFQVLGGSFILSLE